MANGRVHDSINLIVGTFSLVFLFLNGVKGPSLLLFYMGILFSTFIFSPDTDLRVFKRAKIIGFFLHFYPKLFSHRGLSHSLFFGTLTRIIYMLVIFIIIVGIIFAPLTIIFPKFLKWSDLYVYLGLLKSYTIKKYFFYFFTGMFLADGTHILTDFFSTIKRLLFKKI